MAIKHFLINTQNPTSLSKYSDNKTIIKKIDVIEGEVKDLFSPIRVTTNLPTDENFQYFIHPATYFSNTNAVKGTDLPIDVIIRYSKYTELIISPHKSGKKLVFRIEYTTIESDPLQIIVSQDLEGYTFSLTSSSKELILTKFKDARPVRSISVGYDVKQSFEMIYGNIEKHILPTLVDLSKEQIEQIGEIQLIDSRTNTVIKRL